MTSADDSQLRTILWWPQALVQVSQEEAFRCTHHLPHRILEELQENSIFFSQKGKLGTQTGEMVSVGLRHWGVSHRAALPAWCCSPQLCTRVDSLLTESFRSLRPVESTVSVFLAFPSQSWAKHRRISLAICESLDCPRFSFSYLEESWCWGWNLGPCAFYVIL